MSTSEILQNVKLQIGDEIHRLPNFERMSIVDLRQHISKIVLEDKHVAVRYRDDDGDFVTLSTDEDLHQVRQLFHQGAGEDVDQSLRLMVFFAGEGRNKYLKLKKQAMKYR